MSRQLCVLCLLAAFPALALADQPNAAAVTISAEPSVLVFRIGAEEVGRYHIEPTVAKPYFYPLLAPGNVGVTRGWPMVKGLPKETTDHVHQKSAWFCHGDVIPEGIKVAPSGDKNVKGVDFWSEGKGHGIIACVNVTATGNKAITSNEWRDSAGTKILDETRSISLSRVQGGTLLVFDITLVASVCPLTFGDTKEGSFGVRVSDQMTLKSRGSKNALTNAEGKSGMPAVWGMLSDWCDYSGEIDGKLAGIAIFDDPRNVPRAAWHSRDYGLMAANPFGRSASGFPARKDSTDLAKLPKGQSLKLRYGLFLHAGDVKTGKVAEAYAEFSK